jgi:adenosine deaminase
MKKLASIKEAFKKEGLDIDKLEIIGCPERHVEAAKAIIKMWVGYDHVNSGFNPDWTNYEQYKYQNFYKMGSSSVVGFSYSVYDYWGTASAVGSRLTSESWKAAEYIGEHPEFLELAKTVMIYQRPEVLEKDNK